MATNDPQASALPLVFPIGHFTGVFSDEDDPEERLYQVRRADDVIALADAAFAIWGLCHGQPDRPSEDPLTRSAVLELAERSGVPDSAAIIKDLAAENLVSEVLPGTRQAVRFAEAYRLHPTLLGLGNSAADPTTFSIGVLNTPMLQVSRNIFELWRWSPAAANLWDVCQFFAEAERSHGETDPASTDPEVVLTGFLHALHGLLTGGAVYLDPTE
ncbi:MAG: hypothetical protein ACRDT8_22305 [Micromonosporaceae bacterium]